MRKLNRGQLLNKDELKEIASNFSFTNHSKQRMLERGMSEKDVESIILNPLLAYFNTDGSINIAKDKFNYFVIVKDDGCDYYTIITYKEKSWNSIDIFEKRKMAIDGYDRRS